MLGQSEGNGHPFSFSAILNGYEKTKFKDAGWDVILDYLERQPREMFGLGDARVTHVWTQFPQVTIQLREACVIPNAVERPEEMLGQIDALIVARDDWECHARLAMPFLQRGIPIFVDKPLTLNQSELGQFEPYLDSGRLMSTSGLRFAGELDAVKDKLPESGNIRLIQATVINEMEKYGIHMLDAVAALGVPAPVTILRLPTEHQTYLITLANGSALLLNCLGRVSKTFHLSIFAEKRNLHVDLHDNFTAFRRTLSHFLQMVVDHIPPIDPRQVIGTMNLIRAAQTLQPGETASLSRYV